MAADLSKLGLLLALYGGLAVLGLLTLLLGMYAARRRGPIIAAAATCGVLALLQATLLYFLSDLARAWGGDADRALVAGGALLTLAGFLAVPAFLAHKLPRVNARDAAGWSNSALAGSVIVLCVLIHLASSLGGLGARLLHPRFWLVTIVGLLAAWGLWRHLAWARWLALIGSAWELLRFAQWLIAHPAGMVAAFVSWSGLTAVLLVGVVLLVLRGNGKDAPAIAISSR